MQIDLAQSIREVLDNKQTVSINGLGSIKLVNKPARFGEGRNSIKPPRVDLSFEEATSSNTPLIEHIIDKYKIDKKKAESSIKSFNEKLINALLNYSKVNIQGVGLFTINSDGKINVEADKGFIGMYYKGLPEIPISLAPVIETKEEQIDKTIVEKPIFFDPDIAFQESIAKKEFSPPEPKPDVQTVPPVSITEEEGFVNPFHEEKKEKRSLIWPILALLILILICFISFRTCQYLRSNSGETEQFVSDEPIETGLGDDSLLSDLPDSCIIITGVFASSANVERMDEKLLAAGYEIYHETHGPYTRVGLSFECQDLILEDYIQNIRSSIADKAWYLDPLIHVEYEVN